MTAADAPAPEPAGPPAGSARGPRPFAVLLGVTLAAAGVAGAILDWILWEPYSGIVITLVAVPLLAIGGIVAIVARGRARLTFLVVAAIGGGLLLGQAVGPAREPLQSRLGVLTLTLASPVAARATAPVTCTTVASGTEFAISGDPNMRLETPQRPFISMYATLGDRWVARRSASRSGGVQFELTVMPQEVPSDGKPQEVHLSATDGTTLVTEFRNDGGSVAFEGLAPDTIDDWPLATAGLDGAPFTGTATWTCGEAAGG